MTTGTPLLGTEPKFNLELNFPITTISPESLDLAEQLHQPFDPLQELESVLNAIQSLYERPENWNGYKVASPNPEAIQHALTWMTFLYATVVCSGKEWITPHITSDEEGNVVFEWSHDKRELTLYILPEGIEFIRTPGSTTEEESEEGEITSDAERDLLWQWLAE